MYRVSFVSDLPKELPLPLQSLNMWYFSKKIWWWLPFPWGNPNFLDLIDENKFKEEMQNDQAFLIIDFSSDAPYVDFIEQKYLIKILLFFKKYKISQSRLIIITAAPDNIFFKQSNGYSVKKKYKHIFFNPFWYSTKKEFLRSTSRKRSKNIDKCFFCLMRKDSNPRRLLNYLLHYKDIHQKGFVTHHRMTYLSEDVLTDCKNYLHKNSFNKNLFLKYGYQKHSLDFSCLLPDNTDTEINKNYYINSELSARTFIEVVVETADIDRLFITEKTLKAILLKNVFITLNTPGTLRYLKSLGFKTFHPLIDEDYDSITDLYDRIDIISDQLKKLSNYPNRKLQALYDELNEVTEYNYQHYIYNEWTFSLQERIENYLNETAIFKSK